MTVYRLSRAFMHGAVGPVCDIPRAGYALRSPSPGKAVLGDRASSRDLGTVLVDAG